MCRLCHLFIVGRGLGLHSRIGLRFLIQRPYDLRRAAEAIVHGLNGPCRRTICSASPNLGKLSSKVADILFQRLDRRIKFIDGLHTGGLYADGEFLPFERVDVLDQRIELIANDLNLQLNSIDVSRHRIPSNQSFTVNPAPRSAETSAPSNQPLSTTSSCALSWNGLAFCPFHGYW